MITGNGPPRSGWVMKVVVWPSLVGISICWSIMGVLFSLAVGGFLLWQAIRLQGNRHMTRRPAVSGRYGLELRRRDRHCEERPTPVPPTGEFPDDPDQQSVFRRDRPPDERRRGCCPGRQARSRYRGPQPGREDPA